MLILAKELNKISDDKQKALIALAEEVSKIISGLIKSISPQKSLLIT
jgi:hypothetical protein